MKEKIAQLFSSVKDFRVNRTKAHDLNNILFITLLATMTGRVGWNSIANYGKVKKDELECILDLPNGIPSHDTVRRVMSNLDMQQVVACFRNFSSIVCSNSVRVIRVDGKAICGSSKEERAIQTVSAFIEPLKMVLDHIKVEDTSNEITAVMHLLDKLDLTNCVVTADAMHCQRETCKKIVQSSGNYIVAVKKNQKELYKTIQAGFKKKVSSTRFTKPMKRIAVDQNPENI